MTVRLEILGPLRVRRAGTDVDTGPPQQRCLLALLLAREGRPVSTGELIDALWGEGAPPTATNIIQKYVGAVRRLLEPGLPSRTPGRYVVRHGDGYRFTAGPDTLDLVRFRRLAAEAKRQAEGDRALDLYAEALRLGHGPAGEGVGDTPAARAVFAGVDGEFLDAALAAARLAVPLGRSSLLIAPVRRAAEMDPLHEPVQAALVTVLATAGRRAEALAAYRAIRRRLADDLGISPGPELRDAYRQVLVHRDLTGEAVGRKLFAEVIELCERLPPALARLAAHLDAAYDS
ncbi:BTAD domain-containing putative transcriptional regulator [Asanoa sp. NPDC049573]|uniref:AfsR/SARP family transcriptional regulator n=1 Tax=Asanoa sp. NPDC049573 TaxID=3155396 RepID=UPI003432158A